jgi:hypothetical protein
VLDWYRTGGSDDHFLDFPERQQMPQHGPLFETLVAGAQSTARGVSGHAAWAEPWHVRSVVTGLTGVVGIGLIGLCGVELGRAARRMRRAGGSDPAAERDDASAWWLGLVAAVGLALYPRYTGGMFNNSKDVPLAVAMVLVLWLTMRLARRWVERPERLPVLDAILVGLALGAAMSIRVNALVWYGILGCLALGWLALRWRRGRPDRLADLRRVVLTSALVAGTSYLSILAMWPYIFLNPVTGLPDAFASMSRYQWDNPILYGGEMVPAMHLPATYPLTWLWLGSPWLTVVLAVVGLGFVVADVARRRIDAAPLLVAAAFVLPLLALVVLRPTWSGRCRWSGAPRRGGGSPSPPWWSSRWRPRCRSSSASPGSTRTSTCTSTPPVAGSASSTLATRPTTGASAPARRRAGSTTTGTSTPRTAGRRCATSGRRPR